MAQKDLILVSEDQVGPREALRFILKEDYELLFAENGVEVLRHLKNETPGLILMDIRMPKLDGWGAIREIRAQGISVPIIVLTGYPNPSDEEKVKRLSVAHYLTKPFDLFELRHLVEQTLSFG